MIHYALELFMIASLGLVLYLVARAVPRVSDVDISAPVERQVPHWVTNFFERFDMKILAVAEKFIRRIRLWIMKLDTALLERLHRFRKSAASGVGRAKSIVGEMRDEEIKTEAREEE